MRSIDMRNAFIGIVVVIFWHAVDSLTGMVVEQFLAGYNPWIIYTALTVAAIYIFNYLDYEYV